MIKYEQSVNECSYALLNKSILVIFQCNTPLFVLAIVQGGAHTKLRSFNACNSSLEGAKKLILRHSAPPEMPFPMVSFFSAEVNFFQFLAENHGL